MPRPLTAMLCSARNTRWLDELEESGRVHCIRPNDPITIGRFEGDENKLLDLYNRGHREGREKLEELRTYLEK